MVGPRVVVVGGGVVLVVDDEVEVDVVKSISSAHPPFSFSLQAFTSSHV